MSILSIFCNILSLNLSNNCFSDIVIKLITIFIRLFSAPFFPRPQGICFVVADSLLAGYWPASLVSFIHRWYSDFVSFKAGVKISISNWWLALKNLAATDTVFVIFHNLYFMQITSSSSNS